jgi:ribosomal protein L11
MIFNKKIKGNLIKVKLVLPAGSISVAPPLTTALGQYRVDMSQLVKNFNENTKMFEKGVLLPVKLSLKVGGTVNYIISSPSITYLVKRLLIEAVILNQKRLTNLMYYKILCIKMQTSNLARHAVLRSILSTIKSMQLNKYHNL